MGIADANIAGNVHGGLIMHLCDEVAGIAAVRLRDARRDGRDGPHELHQPVLVGQLVTVKATVNAAWRTSMEVGVRVESEHVRSGEVLHVDRLPDDGRPRRRGQPDRGAADRPEDAGRDEAAREAQLRRDTRLAERERIEEDRAQSER